MPVEFGPYQSVYVSQKSPEISETLRNRYVQNFSMQDEVQQRLLELQAAPFSGDQAEKDKLNDDITSQMDALSNRGDYENMSMDVAKLARRYQDVATPLGQNQAAYQKNKDEQLASVKSGTLSKRDYDLWERSASRVYDSTVGDYVDYEGLRFDESGKVDNDSLYQATTVAATVDVDSEILTALNNLKEVKTGGASVQKLMTENGVEYMVMHQGQIVEKVPDGLVQQATEAVLGRADVQSYMDQQAHFNTVSEDEEGINSALAQEISRLKGSDDPNDRAAATNLEKALHSSDLGAKRRAAKDAQYAASYQKYMEFGANARGTSAYGGMTSIDYSQKEMALFGAKLRGTKPPAPVHAPGLAGRNQQIVSALANDAGKVTEKSTDTYLEGLQEASTAQMGILSEDLPHLFYVPDANGGVTEEQWDASDIKAFLRTADIEDIDILLTERSDMLVDPSGAKMTKDLATRKLVAAKAAIEEQDIISAAVEEIRAKYLTDSGITPESYSELFGEVFSDVQEGFSNELILDAFISRAQVEGTLEENMEGLGTHFSTEDIAASQARLVSGTSEYLNERNYLQSLESPSAAIIGRGPAGMDLYSPNDPIDNAVGSYFTEIQKKKNAAYEAMEVDGTSMVSFPIYSDVPRAVDPTLVKAFEESLNQFGIGTIGDMVPADYELQGVGPPSVQGQLAGNEPLKITGIGYTQGLDRQGNSRNLVAVTMDVGSGTTVKKSETVYVLADQIMTNVQDENGGNLADQFKDNTLDQKVMGEAYKIVNHNASHYAEQGYVEVKFDDGGYTGRGQPSNTQIIVRFPVTKTNAGTGTTGEAGAFTYAVGNDDIYIGGTAGGKEIPGKRYTIKEYRDMMHDLGDSIGRIEDTVAVKRRLARDAARAQ